MAAEFTHLHLHTDYSLLDGACDVDKLAKHLEKIGQKAAAMTDHGNIYGAVHFFDAMKKQDIKPILGCELYICKERRPSRRAGNGDRSTTTCWCSPRTKRATATSSASPARPRCTASIASRASARNFSRSMPKGLIGFSGCLAGEVAQHLMAGKYDEAKTHRRACIEDMFGKGTSFSRFRTMASSRTRRSATRCSGWRRT